MSDAEERESIGAWRLGSDEDDEFAYVEYAEGHLSNKRKRDDSSHLDSSSAASAVDNDAIQSIPDAFLGHHCPICLEAIKDSAMIETCHHLYCRSCLFEWLAVSDRCPLCKVKVSRVLHDIKSHRDYKVHVHAASDGRSAGSSSTPSSSVGSTSAGTAVYGGVSGGADFRSLVYRRGLAAEPPDVKARRPKSVNQLRSWIEREVPAAVDIRGEGAGDTRLIVDVIEALLKDNDVDDQEGYCRVKEQLQDFLFENTAPFLHELWCFRWSKAGMRAYDGEGARRYPGLTGSRSS